MDILIQLISIFYSFVFGALYVFLYLLNMKLKSKNQIIKCITMFWFMICMSFIFITLLYFLNDGIFHFYFFLSLVTGICIVLTKKFMKL